MFLLLLSIYHSSAAYNDEMSSVLSSLFHLKRLCSKQCGFRSDCSSRSSLIWIRIVCLYAEISPWCKHLHTADDFRRRHFQMLFFRGSQWVKKRVRMHFAILVYDQQRDWPICTSVQFDQHCCYSLYMLLMFQRKMRISTCYQTLASLPCFGAYM